MNTKSVKRWIVNGKHTQAFFINDLSASGTMLVMIGVGVAPDEESLSPEEFSQAMNEAFGDPSSFFASQAVSMQMTGIQSVLINVVMFLPWESTEQRFKRDFARFL